LNKNSENFYELKFARKFTGKTWNLDFEEIWPARSWIHLVARKNPFPSKEDQQFGFHSKREFGLIS
jgi:hypothetical protein